MSAEDWFDAYTYNPNNFTLAGRHHAWHKSKEAKVAKNTLYVAVEVGNASYERIAEALNENMLRQSARADTSYDTLRSWLRQRITANPDERWLILAGTALAEISAPPVTFRQV